MIGITFSTDDLVGEENFCIDKIKDLFFSPSSQNYLIENYLVLGSEKKNVFNKHQSYYFSPRSYSEFKECRDKFEKLTDPYFPDAIGWGLIQIDIQNVSDDLPYKMHKNYLFEVDGRQFVQRFSWYDTIATARNNIESLIEKYCKTYNLAGAYKEMCHQYGTPKIDVLYVYQNNHGSLSDFLIRNK